MGSVLGEPSTSSPPKRFERLDVLLDRGRNAVLRQQLADGAVLAFRRSTVVAPDVKDQRVVAVAEFVDLIDDPADLRIDVFGRTRRRPPSGGAGKASRPRECCPRTPVVSGRGVSSALAGIQPIALAR